MNIEKVQRETVLAAPVGVRQDRRWFMVATASRRRSLSEQRRDAPATFDACPGRTGRPSEQNRANLTKTEQNRVIGKILRTPNRYRPILPLAVPGLVMSFLLKTAFPDKRTQASDPLKRLEDKVVDLLTASA
jgi:hypothetical protein